MPLLKKSPSSRSPFFHHSNLGHLASLLSEWWIPESEDWLPRAGPVAQLDAVGATSRITTGRRNMLLEQPQVCM
ncbi:hypothetical protein E4U57_000830 [Claviceps arundinis]|uniref:Uncharacterized protein n=1 Tax=Claviceps arundinis TaxID=1623583 RepID=A0ABQ7PBW2_9HYPO|nr:hypothetical protein E4U57_000830 [Claviceps arundinis]